MSYDEGRTYSSLLDEDGARVKATGKDGDSFFDSVEVDGDNLHILLKDGTELLIPIGEQSLYKAVDLELSVRWASVNLGATSNADAGELYFWGDADNAGLMGMYEAPEIDNLCGSEYDTARAMWGGLWRTPRRAECQELISNCDWVKAAVNGMTGARVTGSNGNSIFLPVTGYGMPEDGPVGSFKVIDPNTGYYWTGNSFYDTGARYAYTMSVSGGNANCNTNWITRFVKMAIRPVRDK